MAEKFLDREGVKTLLQGINNAYAKKAEIKDYDADIANLNGRVLSAEAIKELIKKTYDELTLGKYIVTDKASVLNALTQIEENGSLILEENLDMGNQIVNIPEGKSIVLDLSGKELNLGATGAGIQVMGHLTVENGKINATKRAIAAFQGGSITIGEGAEIVAGDCAVTATGAGSEIIVENGEK